MLQFIQAAAIEVQHSALIMCLVSFVGHISLGIVVDCQRQSLPSMLRASIQERLQSADFCNHTLSCSGPSLYILKRYSETPYTLQLLNQVHGVLISASDLDGTATFSGARLRGRLGDKYDISYSAATPFRSLTVLGQVCFYLFDRRTQVRPR